MRVDCSPRQMVGQDTSYDDLDLGTDRGGDIHLDWPPFIGQIHSIPMVNTESEVASQNHLHFLSYSEKLNLHNRVFNTCMIIQFLDL